MSTLSYNQEQFLHTKGRNKDIKLITDIVNVKKEPMPQNPWT